MTLLYLHQYFKFPDEEGGTRSYDLAKSFANNGETVIVITTTSDEKYRNQKRWNVINRDGLVVHYIFLPYSNHQPYLKRGLVFLQFLWFSSFKLLKIQADIVLATSTPLTIGIPALFKKWIHKTPFIFEVRDVWPEAVIVIGAVKNKLLQKFLYQLEKLIYKNAISIVPLSVDMKDSIVERYPQYSNKILFVIPNIAEINRFQNCNFHINLSEKLGFAPRFTVLYAGTFGKVNGINYVINLAEKSMEFDPNLIYILIGSGSEKNKIIQSAKNKKVLNKNVFIFDPVSKNDLPGFYKSASMGSSFVIDKKELWANSANKFFDTLAAARPILINHEGWQAEVIRDENIGYILPQSLSDKNVKDFVIYTQNSQLIKEQKRNALKKACESYTLDIAVTKYMEIFDIILKKRINDIKSLASDKN